MWGLPTRLGVPIHDTLSCEFSLFVGRGAKEPTSTTIYQKKNKQKRSNGVLPYHYNSIFEHPLTAQDEGQQKQCFKPLRRIEILNYDKDRKLTLIANAKRVTR